MSFPWGRPKPAGVFFLQSVTVEICLMMVFYGMHTALFLASIPTLARREGRSTMLIIAITVLFLSSTVVTISTAKLYLWRILPCNLNYMNCGGTSAILGAIDWSSRLSFIISDALVVWRAWVVWSSSHVARGVLLLCVILSLGGVILDCVWRNNPTFQFPPKLTAPGLMSTLLFTTNVVATALIGLRLWMYRRRVSAWFAPYSRRSQAESILILLLESGFIYCGSWAFFLFTTIPPSTIVREGDALQTAIFRIFDDLFFLLAGIYPTFVVVVSVLHQQTSAKAMTTGQTGVLETLCFESGRGDTRDQRSEGHLPEVQTFERGVDGRSATFGITPEETHSIELRGDDGRRLTSTVTTGEIVAH